MIETPPSSLFAVPFVLAPMAGYTDLPFRRICRRFGAGAVYTELVSVDGLVRRSAATWHLLASAPDERPVFAHLYGADPAVFGAAAAMIAPLGRFDGIDVNAGCPMPKVVRRGAGAGLMLDLDRLAAIVREIRAAAPLPVSVKTRTGPTADHVLIFELADAIEAAGASALTIHARPTAVRHSGPADWDLIAEVKRRHPKLVVIGNGGIGSGAQAVERWRTSGVDAVMIGRGAIGRPWIFRDAAAVLEGRPPAPPPGPDEVRALIREHFAGLLELERSHPLCRRRRHPPEHIAACRFRAHLLRYAGGRPGAAELRRRLNSVRSPAAIEEGLTLLFGPDRPAADVPPD
ncbi:MAG: tRNA-dihydrouridine synthase [Kiritimatiellae bacterium]|nr:tRNA-dihydrouridine synthase [Kiritimatiellia bacterium]